MTPFFSDSASLTALANGERAGLFCTSPGASGLVSITTFLLVLEKMKLAVLVGDFRKSLGEVGEFRLRREAGDSLDRAAVLSRITSCRFMEGAAVAEGDFFTGETTVVEDAGEITIGGTAAVAGGDFSAGEEVTLDEDAGAAVVAGGDFSTEVMTADVDADETTTVAAAAVGAGMEVSTGGTTVDVSCTEGAAVAAAEELSIEATVAAGAGDLSMDEATVVSRGAFSIEETTVAADAGETSIDGATVVSGGGFSTEETTVDASETSTDGAAEV